MKFASKLILKSLYIYISITMINDIKANTSKIDQGLAKLIVIPKKAGRLGTSRRLSLVL